MESPIVPAVRKTFAKGSAFNAPRMTLPFDRSAMAAAAAPPIQPRFFSGGRSAAMTSGRGGGIGVGFCIGLGFGLLSEQLAGNRRDRCEQSNDAFLPGHEQGEEALPELREDSELRGL